MSPYILARMAAFIQGQKYKVEPHELVASQAQLVMPLAAMVPLGIITVAIGLAGLGMGGVHYVFQGEVRDRFQGPSPGCPRFASKQAPLHTVRKPRGEPPLSRAHVS